MERQNITFEKVTTKNIKGAIKAQRTIFPGEDGAINLQICADKSLVKKYYGKESDYREVFEAWVARDKKDNIVGITGIYSYFEYPEDAWLGWFGVLPNFRRLGYGQKILLWTMARAKDLGFKNFRLYTDLVDDKEAVELYRKVGMIEEPYLTEVLDANTFIFSKSLNSNITEKLGNKMLFLKEQEEIQNQSSDIEI